MTTPTTIPSRQHLPALDGLRGTAILAVLLCHYSSLLPQSSPLPGILTFGWTGVDLFFVLSGFLITGILLDTKNSPHYFRNFYARRILRIFPLYFGFLTIILLLLLTLTFAPFKSLDPLRPAHNQDVHLLWTLQPWLWTYTANFWLAVHRLWGDWIDIVAPLWSLSVEEQFYFVWPLIIFSFSHRNLIRICLTISLAALLTRLILTSQGTNWFALYVMTPTRCDPLAAGSLLALLIRLPNGIPRARRLSRSIGPAAFLLLILIGPGFNPFNHPWLADFLYSLLAILFASLLFWSIDPASLRGIPNRFYELPLLQTLGRYSYCIYLTHLPLMHLTEFLLGYHPPTTHWLPSLSLVALCTTITFAFSFASFHLYEKQFLKLKRHFPE
jgi:peptidoglycan/LPS O-acetylase OafA/YrhL